MSMTKKKRGALTKAAESKPEYTPTAVEQAMMEGRRARYKAKVPAPRLKIVENAEGVRQATHDHESIKVWVVKLCETFGTDNFDAAHYLMGQVTHVAIQDKGPNFTADDMSAPLAVVDGIGPRDMTEGMLATQMAAVHHAAMTMMTRTCSAPDAKGMEAYGNLATKMLRTFTAQMDTLKRYRSKGEQRVVVQHQHVNVTAEQAAVQVNASPLPPLPGGGMPGGDSETEGQPHAITGPDASFPPLLCADPQGHALPSPGGSWPEAMPDARRG